MPVPWMQIVQLMPSIVDLSRELLRRTTAAPAAEPLEGRIAALEENERRQAELVKTMADQLAQLTSAVTQLHSQVRALIAGQIAVGVIAIAALIAALR
jgi:uncharacterized coiled-coil protein SlyX